MKKLVILCLAAYLTAALVTPTRALDYAAGTPKGSDYGKSTSVEVMYTADGGTLKNEDISKDTALIPPGFGSASADSMITRTWLTLNLVPEDVAMDAVSGGGIPIVFPPSTDASTIFPAGPGQGTGPATLDYTPVTSDLYYSDGYLGTSKIPSIDLSVRVYEGTDSSTFARGVGHFEGTSVWNGNMSIADHNRRVRDGFGDLHTLEQGNTVTWIAKLGTRAHEVTSVEKVRRTNTSGTAPFAKNMLTLYTCVRSQWEYRWQVHVVEVV